MPWFTIAVSSEDDDKRAEDGNPAMNDYEGDYGGSYTGELGDVYDLQNEDGDGDGDADDDYKMYRAPDDTGADSEGSEDSEDGISGDNGDDDDIDDDDDDGEDDEDDNDDGNGSNGSARWRRRSMRAGPPGPPVPQHNFAPPFYGRPPTPLPPSPSLTSLLRPSRPTTPDATDDELEPVPRAAPQVPTYEYYGFALYLFSSLAFLMYLLWSYLPSPFLHGLGIYYYPNRWWSLAIPSFLTMALVYTYVALASYNTEILTLPLNSIETIVDGAAKMAAVDDRGRVVVVGGPDGRRLQGKSGGGGRSVPAPVRADADSGGRNGHSQGHGHGHSRRQDVAPAPSSSASAWPHLPWANSRTSHHHYRQLSSPSPPLGGVSGWNDGQKFSATGGGGGGGGSSGRHNKNKTKQGKRSAGGSGKGRDDRSGLTMGSSRNAWNKRQSGGREAEGGGKHCRPDWNSLWSEGTDAVMDIPLAGVCEVLYA